MPFIKKSLHYWGYCYIWIHKSYSIALQGEFCQSASCAASWNMPTNFWGELSFSTATIRKPLNTVELSVPAIDTATKEIRSVQRVLTGNSSSGILIWRHLLVGLSRVIHPCWPQNIQPLIYARELGRAFFGVCMHPSIVLLFSLIVHLVDGVRDHSVDQNTFLCVTLLYWREHKWCRCWHWWKLDPGLTLLLLIHELQTGFK